MSDTSQTDIVTESKHETDGSLKIRSIMKLQHCSSIIIESLWKPIQENSSLEMVGTSVHIGDMAFGLPRSTTLLSRELTSSQWSTLLPRSSRFDLFSMNQSKTIDYLTRRILIADKTGRSL